MFASSLGRLRVIAIVEGISFILLLFVAMPLKYMAGIPLAVKICGMAHGALFILFCWFLIDAWTKYKWKTSFASLVFVSSLIPFATFWMDVKLKELEQTSNE